MRRFGKERKIKKFFHLYTSGLNRKEVEQLLKKDTVEAFEYLKRKTVLETPSKKQSRLHIFIRTFREIAVSFIMRMSPARRLFYGIAVLLFFIGLFQSNVRFLLLSFFVLNGLLVLELVDKLTTRDELEIAREIQIGLQPDDLPASSMLSMATFSKPAKVVGGDFFDIMAIDKDWMMLMIGDVSGKGISAALYAAYIQSMFQSLSDSPISPAKLLTRLNDLLSKRLRDGHFITALIALFNIPDKSMVIARAGHNWPIYYQAKSKTVAELKPKGMSIGVLDHDQFAAVLEEQRVPLESGDCMLFYTDGITEAANPDKRMFDIGGLKEALTDCATESCQIVIDKIDRRLRNFVESEEFQDDATMIAVKIR